MVLSHGTGVRIPVPVIPSLSRASGSAAKANGSPALQLLSWFPSYGGQRGEDYHSLLRLLSVGPARPPLWRRVSVARGCNRTSNVGSRDAYGEFPGPRRRRVGGRRRSARGTRRASVPAGSHRCCEGKARLVWLTSVATVMMTETSLRWIRWDNLPHAITRRGR